MFDAVACETEARSCLRLAKKETDPAVKMLLSGRGHRGGMAPIRAMTSRKPSTNC
jgi:hypothetical protein